MKAVQTEQVGASQYARLELQAPGDGEGKGTLVELKGKDGKAMKSIVLGKKQTKKSEGGPFGGGEAKSSAARSTSTPSPPSASSPARAN